MKGSEGDVRLTISFASPSWEKEKEIIDSISYAKRIQTALLPNEKRIGKELKKLMNHEGKC